VGESPRGRRSPRCVTEHGSPATSSGRGDHAPDCETTSTSGPSGSRPASIPGPGAAASVASDPLRCAIGPGGDQRPRPSRHYVGRTSTRADLNAARRDARPRRRPSGDDPPGAAGRPTTGSVKLILAWPGTSRRRIRKQLAADAAIEDISAAHLDPTPADRLVASADASLADLRPDPATPRLSAVLCRLQFRPGNRLANQPKSRNMPIKAAYPGGTCRTRSGRPYASPGGLRWPRRSVGRV
jgi:hypothetical protein